MRDEEAFGPPDIYRTIAYIASTVPEVPLEKIQV